MTQNTVDDPVWFPGAPAELVSAVRTLDRASGLRASVSIAPGSILPELVVHEADGLFIVELPAATAACTLALSLPLRDPVTLWTPGSEVPHGTLPASWAPARRISALDGVAIGALVSRRDRAALTYAADAGGAPIAVRGGVVEETAELLIAFEAPPDTPIAVRVDVAGASFAESVARAGLWLGRAVAPSTEADERPVFCTWYYAHQDLRQDDLSRQAERAAAFGFGTVIVDDGWQTDGDERGYASAGDWLPARTKLPDPLALTSHLRELGLRTLWWIGTPFIGRRSDAHAARTLPVLYDVPELEAAVLDVRSRAVRDHIRSRVIGLLERAGGDGFKLDFLERFAAPAPSPAPADADHDDAEAAALTLLRELVEDARRIRPDLMIELREPYVGAEVRALASMIRVEDCPVSPLENRLGIADLRLVAPQTAVHSDPVMWSADDSPERVAHYLLSALMGVPQVSTDLLRLSAGHAEVLRFWLTFWNQNADTILHGSFVPHRPDLGYPVIEARGAEDVVIVRYAPVLVTLPDGDWRRISLANADDEVRVPLAGAPGDYRLTVTDARGAVVERGSVDPATVGSLTIPSGGLATLTR
ncbi:alpha-galactosidase [uncultured Leifsonia sp.]|uniref:glycoside hydrolase family 36 protein n=1 Tax=uncultured Leifsonia sp. TaxID=340359 RepID=UPI0028D378BC|nr:alpha-galactosidase [uncultured Leifsonia sp.]